MDSNLAKYKEHTFSRYFILKEGLFKNTKKLINIYRDGILIENIDETELELLSYEDIINIEFSEKNIKEFKITYKNQKQIETSASFSTTLRTQVISDLLRQIVKNII
jgi:hypothetical protein